MIRCEELKSAIETRMPKIFSCNQNGDLLELDTPFLYPEGDVVSIYVKPEDKRIIITDAGETFRNLFHYNITTSLTKNREKILCEVLSVFKINNLDGELWLEIKDISDLSMGLMRLSQSITRLMDLTYTVRYVPKTNFNSRISAFLKSNQIISEIDNKIKGASGEKYKIDFTVVNNNKRSLIRTLSCKDVVQANILVSKTFRAWYDIDIINKSKKLTLLDDENDFWRPEWKMQLKYFSEVIKFDDKDSLLEFLMTA